MNKIEKNSIDEIFEKENYHSPNAGYFTNYQARE